MIIGISVISCSLIYSILLLILYFSKSRIQNMENRIYSILVVINVIGLILELLCCYYTYKNGTTAFYSLMCLICNRLFIIYMLTWVTIFTYYIFYISQSSKNKSKKHMEPLQKRSKQASLIIYIVFFVLASFLPLDYVYDGTYVYSEGPAVNLLVVCAIFYVIFDIICVARNRKNLKTRQYAPLIVLIILMIGVIIIRLLNPGIVLINSTFAFITVLMYFTIENPDIQMISELYKNKKLIEKSNEDTSRFLFRITGDLKNPVKEIINTSNDMKTLKSKEEMLEANKYIYEHANNLDFLLNKALNISDMDTKKIKIYDTKYNVYNLFEEITRHAKEEIGDKLEFKQSMGTSIPTYLYGDSIKIKQAISSIIRICEKFTSEGFINLDVSSLIKYNICRLIITIEDSGKGISIDRVNEILSMTNDNIHVSEEKDLNIIEVKKLINILGGSLMIKSEEEKGTTVVITLDQKIVETRETEITKRLENYEQTLKNSKKILLIDDDEEELNKITKLLEKEDIDITSSMIGRDAIEKIRNKNKYDLIILDDELAGITALTILKELKNINTFKTPVIIMINDNKETIKLEYLKDGFADTISKTKLDTEIERIIKRFQ